MEPGTIVHCERCGARCRGGLGNPAAKMLRRANQGMCVNCAVHDWLRNTYPCNMLLAESGPKVLAYQHIRDQFAQIMRIGNADATPEEINWNLISENWELPFPNKIKPTSSNPCTQKDLEEIAAGKRRGIGAPPKPDPLGGKMTITKFEEFNVLEPGLGDQLKNLLTKEKIMSKKKTKGEQIPLFDAAPENAEEIMEVARRYKEIQNVRLKALKEEVELKDKVKELVKKADLQPLKGGVIKFRHSGLIFCVTPRDELITITKEKKKKGKKKGMKEKVETEENDFEEDKK